MVDTGLQREGEHDGGWGIGDEGISGIGGRREEKKGRGGAGGAGSGCSVGVIWACLVVPRYLTSPPLPRTHPSTLEKAPFSFS